MPDWDPNDAEPATKHLLMAVIEIDQVIKDHNTRLEEIEVRFSPADRYLLISSYYSILGTPEGAVPDPGKGPCVGGQGVLHGLQCPFDGL